jgi:uncharacterized protein (DUF1330 family)
VRDLRSARLTLGPQFLNRSATEPAACLVSGNAHTRSTVVDFRQRLVPSTRILLPSSKRFEVNYRIKALADSGQKRLASGGKTIALAGAPPASRIVLSAVKNIEEAQAAYSSPAYLEARKIGDRYAKLRIFVVEGLPQ